MACGCGGSHGGPGARRHTMGVCFSIAAKASSRDAYGPGGTLLMAEYIRASGSITNRGPADFVMCPTGRFSRSARTQTFQPARVTLMSMFAQRSRASLPYMGRARGLCPRRSRPLRNIKKEAPRRALV